MKHKWILKDLPEGFLQQHLKFIMEEEQDMQRE